VRKEVSIGRGGGDGDHFITGFTDAWFRVVGISWHLVTDASVVDRYVFLQVDTVGGFVGRFRTSFPVAASSDTWGTIVFGDAGAGAITWVDGTEVVVQDALPELILPPNTLLNLLVVDGQQPDALTGVVILESL